MKRINHKVRHVKTAQELKKPSGNALLVWNLPVGLKRSFKAKCAAKGVTMQEAVIKFMLSFLEQ